TSKATQDRAEKERLAREGIAALNTRIARIEIALPPGAPDGTTIAEDGKTIAPGTVVLVDPGTHMFDVVAPGCEADRVRVTVREGDRAAPKLATGSCGSGNLARTLGIVSLGVGGASLVAGIATGGAAVSKRASILKSPGCSQAASLCPASSQSEIDDYERF